MDFGHGAIPAGTTGAHVLFVTLGRPTSERDRNEDIVHRYPSPLPPGVTMKRMAAAMRLVGKAKAEDATDTHTLVAKLLALFPEFSLAKGSHYVNDVGGAWRMRWPTRGSVRPSFASSRRCSAWSARLGTLRW